MITKILSTPLSASIAACIGYGIWSAFCNWSHGIKTAISAFLVQGSFAFTSTLLLSVLAITLMRKLSDARFTKSLTFLICYIFIATIPASLHWLAGTPEIFASILPGLIIGSAYLTFLLKQHQPQKT